MIEDSIFVALEKAKSAIPFEQLLERVQQQQPTFTRADIAGALARLITRQRVFLNQERTGFCAARMKRDAGRNLERAVMRAAL